MLFSVRVAPGLRLTASRRGIRAAIGPRATRLHVGAGRPGVSTGAGLFTLYSSIGGSRKTGSTIPPQPYLSASNEKAAVARELESFFAAMGGIHRQTFDPVRKPVAPEPVLPDFTEILGKAEKNELKRVSRLSLSARKVAKKLARDIAEQHALSLLGESIELKSNLQTQLDHGWDRLVSNDPDSVFEVLNDAFQDNDAPAAAVGVEGHDASVVVLVAGMEAIPERYPTATAAGNLSIKKMTKSVRNDHYKVLVCGNLLVTASESFAVAPGIRSVTLVAVRASGDGHHFEPIFATKIKRVSLQSIPMSSLDPSEVVDQVGMDTCLRTKGLSKELQPLDVKSEPDLKRLLSLVHGHEFERTYE